MSGSVHHATLRAARVLAPDVVEYDLALDSAERDLDWRAGQFISVRCGDTPDGNAILRSYSIASRGGTGRVLLLLKLTSGPGSAFFRGLAPGDRVRFTGPMGFFVLDLQHGGDVVLGATGTGIAPFLPMLDELIDRGEPGRIHLVWGQRHARDLHWAEELTALAARAPDRVTITTSLSQPDDDWGGPRGRITPRIIDLLPSLTRPTFYLCGNGAMIREVKSGLVERGVDRKRQIRTEAFFD